MVDEVVGYTYCAGTDGCMLLLLHGSEQESQILVGKQEDGAWTTHLATRGGEERQRRPARTHGTYDIHHR